MNLKVLLAIFVVNVSLFSIPAAGSGGENGEVGEDDDSGSETTSFCLKQLADESRKSGLGCYVTDVKKKKIRLQQKRAHIVAAVLQKRQPKKVSKRLR